MAQPKYKIVISDCHLSAGRVFEGLLNPHEDFYFDSEMAEMFEHFSSGEYAEADVELFINGDFLDFLNVPYQGEFEEVITEKIALYKCDAILNGHPKVMDAIQRFASRPNKKVTYLVGNHDAELFFPSVREKITRRWDPNGTYPSERVEVVADRDRINWEGGIEVHHGNQFEAVHVMNFEKPLIEGSFVREPVLNIPWGSFYVLKIVNRLKPEREYLDKVRPIKLFVMIGMLVDPWFTLRYVGLSIYYFLKTRLVYSPRRRARIKVTAEILKQETKFFQDLEEPAREILTKRDEINTVIFGHTHKPMDKIYPDGKQYINTGTWTKMINLDLRSLGQQYCLTFAYVKIEDEKAQCELRQWVGPHSPHQPFRS